MKRSKQLHNFNLPADGLSWGRVKFLRSMNPDQIHALPPATHPHRSSDHSIEHHRVDHVDQSPEQIHRSNDGSSRRKLKFRLRTSSSSPSPVLFPSPATDDRSAGKRVVSGDDDDGISQTREKLLMEYQMEIDQMHKSILQKHTSGEGIAPIRASGSPNELDELDTKSKDAATSVKKSTRSRRNVEKKDATATPKFSISLSWNEIEEDFFAITGKKPPRKPNRRPKNVQMNIDNLCPGLRLSEVHPDRYKVKEKKNK